MKFKNKLTGVILETNNKFVIEQLKKDENLEEVKVFTKEEKKETKKSKKEDL